MRTPPEEMRKRLLEASARLERGGVDVSVDEMAREAEVPRATMYYYFSGRDDLVSFLFNEKIESMAAVVQQAIESEASVPDRLAGVVTALFRAMAAQPALCLEMPTVMQKPDTFAPTLQKAELTVMAPIRGLLEEGIADGSLHIDDLDVAMGLFQGAVWQLAMGALLSAGPLDPDHLTETTAPMLLGAFGAG